MRIAFLNTCKALRLALLLLFLPLSTQANGGLPRAVVQGLRTDMGVKILSQIISRPLPQVQAMGLPAREQALSQALDKLGDASLRTDIVLALSNSKFGFDTSIKALMSEPSFIEAFRKIEVSPPELVGVARFPEKEKAFPEDFGTKDIELGPLKVSVANNEVSLFGEKVTTARTQVAVLYILSSHPGQLFTFSDLSKGLELLVPGSKVDESTRKGKALISRYISHLRNHLKPYEDIIYRKKGAGYGLKDINALTSSDWEQMKAEALILQQRAESFRQREDIEIGSLNLSPQRGDAFVDGKRLGLSPIQLKILFILASHPHQAFKVSDLRIEIENLGTDLTSEQGISVWTAKIFDILGSYRGLIEKQGKTYKLTDLSTFQPTRESREFLFSQETLEIFQKKEDIVVGDLKISLLNNEVFLNEKKLQLYSSEISVLFILASHPEKIWTKFEIVEALEILDIFTSIYQIENDVPIIRTGLQQYGSMVETVRGQGYRFNPSAPLSFVNKSSIPEEIVAKNLDDFAKSPDLIRGDLRISPSQEEAFLNGKKIHLDKVNFKLLFILASKPGEILSPSYLQGEMESLGHVFNEIPSVRVNISRLRRQLEDHSHWIETVPGEGYRFVGDF